LEKIKESWQFEATNTRHGRTRNINMISTMHSADMTEVANKFREEK
jgi:hypothetical protein